MYFILFVHRHQGFFFHYYAPSTWHTGDVSKYMMKEEMNDSFLPQRFKTNYYYILASTTPFLVSLKYLCWFGLNAQFLSQSHLFVLPVKPRCFHENTHVFPAAPIVSSQSTHWLQDNVLEQTSNCCFSPEHIQ